MERARVASLPPDEVINYCDGFANIAEHDWDEYFLPPRPPWLSLFPITASALRLGYAGDKTRGDRMAHLCGLHRGGLHSEDEASQGHP